MKKPGSKRGPRLATLLKQVDEMKLKPGESVVLGGLRFTKTAPAASKPEAGDE